MFYSIQEPSKLRDQLIDAALNHVVFDGWTAESIAAGAADIGIDADIAICAFPGQPIDLLGYHSDLCDRRMVEALKELNLSEMRVRDSVSAAIKIRLGALDSHKSALRSGITILASPVNTPATIKISYSTVNAIWFAIGDSSPNFNFYTKRLLLAGVYISTLLFWLNDKSEEGNETWNFLDRRIADVMSVEKVKFRLANQGNQINDLIRRLREFSLNRHSNL